MPAELLDVATFEALSGVRPGRRPESALTGNSVALDRCVALATSRIDVEVRRGEGRVASQLWLTPQESCAITPDGTVGALRWRVDQAPVESVGRTLAVLLELAPLDGPHVQSPTVLRRDVLERAVGHAGLAARDEAGELLSLDETLDPYWAVCLSSREIRHWTVRSISTDQRDPVASVEALDIPGKAMWIVVDADDEGESVVVIAVMSREVWQILSRVLDT